MTNLGWRERGRARRAARKQWKIDRFEGVSLDSDQSIDLGRVRDLDRLLHALRVLEGNSILYIEHTLDPEILQFLDENSVEPEPIVDPGTWWPRPERRYVPLTGEILDSLLAFSAVHADPEVCGHLAVTRGGRVILTAYDAGDGNVYVAADLPADQLAALRRRLT